MNSTLKPSRLIRLAAAAVLAVPLAGFAAERAAQPANKPANAAVRPQRAFTDAELADAVDFMKVHAPNRLKASANIRTPEYKERFERFIVNQKRNLDKLKTDSPKIYELRVQEMTINDDIFEICRQMRDASRNRRPTAKLESDLHAKVEELFDIGIQERKVRIDRLEEMLAQQKKALESDQNNRDRMIETHTDEIARKGVDGAPLNRADSNPGQEVLSEPPLPKLDSKTEKKK